MLKNGHLGVKVQFIKAQSPFYGKIALCQMYFYISLARNQRLSRESNVLLHLNAKKAPTSSSLG
jgi:hypothetical protein